MPIRLMVGDRVKIVNSICSEDIAVDGTPDEYMSLHWNTDCDYTTYQDMYGRIVHINNGRYAVHTDDGRMFNGARSAFKYVPDGIRVKIISGGDTYTNRDRTPERFRSLIHCDTSNYREFSGLKGTIINQYNTGTELLFVILTDDERIVTTKKRNLGFLNEGGDIMPAFEVGQRVRHIYSGMEGIVAVVSNGGYAIGVDHGDGFNGHNLDDTLQSNTGWYYNPNNLEIIEDLTPVDNPFTVGMKVKIPRSFRGNTVTESVEVSRAISNGQDYMYISGIVEPSEVSFLSQDVNCIGRNVLIVVSSINIGLPSGDYFFPSDLEPYFDTIQDPRPECNLVVGELVDGKRIKCSLTERTHEFKPITRIVEENDTFIRGYDDDGWYVHILKGFYRKPRGEREYTRYYAICPEKTAEHIALIDTYTNQMNETNALLERVKAFSRYENYLNKIARFERQREERRIAEERERTEREERERREREERERQEQLERQLDLQGIWCHHARKEISET